MKSTKMQVREPNLEPRTAARCCSCGEPLGPQHFEAGPNLICVECIMAGLRENFEEQVRAAARVQSAAARGGQRRRR